MIQPDYKHFNLTYPQIIYCKKNVQRFLTDGFSMHYEQIAGPETD